jgi:hypothetical protein
LRAFLFCAALAAPGAAWAVVSDADLAEIRGAIERQTAVRSASCPVYQPAAVRFRDVMKFGDDVVQQVQVTDRSGAVWLAYYAMQRQPDGRWRSSGCRVVPPARTISA